MPTSRFSIVLAGVLALTSVVAASAHGQVTINEFLASNGATLADPDFGRHADWIELYNASALVADLTGFTLTDDLADPDKWQFPDGTTMAPDSYLLVWADDMDDGPPAAQALHTSFKLSASGEQIGLFDASGGLRDSVTFGEQTRDVSQGRASDGWRFFETPTPGFANRAIIVPDRPRVSHESGIFGGPIEVRLDATAGAIRYTLGGALPSDTARLYSSALRFDRTTVLRAMTVGANGSSSGVVTRSFVIGEASAPVRPADSQLPVVSLVTDPAHFFSDSAGIYVRGDGDAAQDCEPEPVNWNCDWERPIHVSFFEPSRTGYRLVLDHGAGAKVHGGFSRYAPVKSLALHARRSYGAFKFEHRFFPDLEADSFDDLLLRNSGNDWSLTLFRDAAIQTMTRHLDLDGQAYRPVVVYLNGDYWGIHNLREQLTADYLTTRYEIDSDEVEMIDVEKKPYRGRSEHYDALLDVLEASHLSDSSVMARVAAMVDVEQYLDYVSVQIYAANADWPGNNTKLWRHRTPGGRWRWMLFDTDFGFGGYPDRAPTDHNTLAFALAAQSPKTVNAPWATLLTRKLLENDQLRHRFVQRMAAHMATTFAPDRVDRVLDSLRSGIAHEVPRHLARWPEAGQASEWDARIDVMRTFAAERAAHVRQHVVAQFDEVTGWADLTIRSNEGGHVRAQGLALPRLPGDDFVAPFFTGVPLNLVAVPDSGYRFVGWSGEIESESDTLGFTPSGPATLDALFAVITHAPQPVVVGQVTVSATRPNPATDDLSFEVTLPATLPLSVRVYDALGREVARLADGQSAAGTYPFALNVRSLPTGIYLIAVQAGDERITRRTVVSR